MAQKPAEVGNSFVTGGEQTGGEAEAVEEGAETTTGAGAIAAAFEAHNGQEDNSLNKSEERVMKKPRVEGKSIQEDDKNGSDGRQKR